MTLPASFSYRSASSPLSKRTLFLDRTGEGKELLLRVLRAFKPLSGSKLGQSSRDKDLDVEAFFSEIEGYKSDFAFNLLAELNDPKAQEHFSIPAYILDGLQFLQP